MDSGKRLCKTALIPNKRTNAACSRLETGRNFPGYNKPTPFCLQFWKIRIHAGKQNSERYGMFDLYGRSFALKALYGQWLCYPHFQNHLFIILSAGGSFSGKGFIFSFDTCWKLFSGLTPYCHLYKRFPPPAENIRFKHRRIGNLTVYSRYRSSLRTYKIDICRFGYTSPSNSY